MATQNSEREEYELVLGNKQILAAFFLIVALFGVFFTLGFMVGRNTALERMAREQVKPTEARTAPGSTQLAKAKSAEPKRRQEESTRRSLPMPSGPPRPATEQAVASRKTSTATPQARKQSSTPARSESPEDVVHPKAGELYLQVAALDLEAARRVRATLRKRGFPVVLAPSPQPELYRVLVGPFNSVEDFNRTRADLHDAGFRPIRRQY